MINNSSTYNPFPAILKELPPNKNEIRQEHIDMIQRELFKAGIVLETEEELDSVLKILVELAII